MEANPRSLLILWVCKVIGFHSIYSGASRGEVVRVNDAEQRVTGLGNRAFHVVYCYTDRRVG